MNEQQVKIEDLENSYVKLESYYEQVMKSNEIQHEHIQTKFRRASLLSLQLERNETNQKKK